MVQTQWNKTIEENYDDVAIDQTPNAWENPNRPVKENHRKTVDPIITMYYMPLSIPSTLNQYNTALGES